MWSAGRVARVRRPVRVRRVNATRSVTRQRGGPGPGGCYRGVGLPFAGRRLSSTSYISKYFDFYILLVILYLFFS
jgi:hypothetical protein